MVGWAGLVLVRTLLGIDYIVRRLRIILALLRHVGTMGLFFTHYSFEALNIWQTLLLQRGRLFVLLALREG